MMEFTLSRVVLSICGIVLLAAVLSPVSAIYEESENNGYQEQCETIANMIDLFAESESDYMAICISQILPTGTTLKFEEHKVTITHDEDKYISLTSKHLVVEENVFANNEIIKLTKNGNDVVIAKLTS